MTDRAGSSQPTIRDVALRAGVSRATAGRALAGYGNVGEELRLKVENASQELGYRPNDLARSMRENRTRTIGVVCGDIENPFFARLVRGISDGAALRDVEVIVTNTDEDQLREQKKVDVLLGKRVDGLIVYPARGNNIEHFHRLKRQGVPLVFVDHSMRNVPADAVMVDGARAAEAAVDYLIGLGHESIAIVSEASRATEATFLADPEAIHDLETATQRQSGARLVGYLRALQKAGIPWRRENILSSDGYSAERAFSAVTKRFQHGAPSALFATDNVMTIGAFRGLKALELAIPDDVSLLGFDDLEWTRLVTPPLTVVSQPVLELGRMAAEVLLDRIDGSTDAFMNRTLPTELIVRGSTAGPRRSATEVTA
ncbi:LacI family DNA-binding transcriptional regulator [Arthrobacter sp. 2RAF6]|uniref:LacI family DNA-binding transcriptional regulator n=1 Tax=Arthrobacter sp. 2RAF6 TaxID=3233002 RepID=UPI003F8E5F6A